MPTEVLRKFKSLTIGELKILGKIYQYGNVFTVPDSKVPQLKNEIKFKQIQEIYK